MPSLDLNLSWFNVHELSQDVLAECSRLYSEHYGRWSAVSPHKPGEKIRLSPERIRSFLNGEHSWVATARYGEQLVAYAFAIRGELGQDKRITWVTQLVVHESYRNQDVAKRLLTSLWGFSDQHARGLVTANPFAVRALEKATRRRCEPQVIQQNAGEVYAFGSDRIEYIKDKQLLIDAVRSVIDTQFFVDHSRMDEMLKDASQDAAWTLGKLEEGQEWFAFTFRTQTETTWTKEELELYFQDSERAVREAYSRMGFGMEQPWQKYTPSEVQYIIKELCLSSNSSIADFGCGNGRHVLELARKGFSAVGIDFVPTNIDRAQKAASAEGLQGVSFVFGDCRNIRLPTPQDAILCLYDVIGSFSDDAQNDQIIRCISENLCRGGRTLVGVMNMELTEARAKYRADVMNEPRALTQLPPSRIMQQTGNVFNPDYYLVDVGTSLVYRKEQFEGDRELPAELIIRDRRYRKDEIIQKFESVGIRALDVQFVQLGNWGTPLTSTDVRAKELLFLGEKL